MNEGEEALSRVEALDRFVQSEIKRIDALMHSHHEADSLADAVSQREYDKFEESVRARFLQVNEFRGALDDLGKTMATRRELDAFKGTYADAHEALRSEVRTTGQRLDVLSGKSEGVNAFWRVGISALSAILILIGIYTAVQATSNRNARTPASVTVTVPRVITP